MLRQFSVSAVVIAALSVLPSVRAHYNFESLLINGEETAPYEFVRKTKNNNGPILDVFSDDIICNNGGIDDDILAVTKTRTVTAGDQLGFKINEMFGHPGPLHVYLSKAPETAQTYKGDGDWFKIYELTNSNLTADPIEWAKFVGGGVRNFTFTLPESLPAGEYLLRGESIALHSAGTVGEAQFYIGCAQIKVESQGTGTPGPTIRFPGGYDPEDPGILVNMYWPPLRSYNSPGPRPWPNECTDHSANLNGQESDGDCTPLEESAKGDDPAA